MYIPALIAAHFLISLNKTINEVENTQKTECTRAPIIKRQETIIRQFNKKHNGEPRK